LDRIDLHIEVPRLKQDELTNQAEGEASAKIKERVMAARRVQQRRFAGSGVYCNAQMRPRQVREYCILENEAQKLLKAAILHLQLSGRSYDRILKLARTIADLDSSEIIKAHHVAEATQYRNLDRERR